MLDFTSTPATTIKGKLYCCTRHSILDSKKTIVIKRNMPFVVLESSDKSALNLILYESQLLIVHLYENNIKQL